MRPIAIALLVVASATGAGRGGWEVVSRDVRQDQGDWQVDFTLKNVGAAPVVLVPSELGATVSGLVSNSRVVAHSLPRRSEIAIGGTPELASRCDVIASDDDNLRCREKGTLRVWDPSRAAEAASGRTTIAPGGTLRVSLRLEHQHCIFGELDPLLGRRDLVLGLGPDTIRTSLPLDFERYVAMPKDNWLGLQVDAERKDEVHFVSAPDSLVLDASVPGLQYFRLPERKVRYSTRMRLKFWYLVAPGTEGELKARIAQYRESPNAWKVLSDGGSEHTLKAVGRWVKFEKTIKTESEATTLALDFRIANADVGVALIDDVSLEPIDGAGAPGDSP